MVTGNNEGTIKAQTLDNEYGYECEDIGNDGNPFTYVSVLPCDAVEICREQCPLCEDFINCEDFWTHYYDKHDETEDNETDDNWDNNGSYGLGGGNGSTSTNNPSKATTHQERLRKSEELITYYLRSSSNSVMPNFSKEELVKQIRDRYNHPDIVNQGNCGTCLYAALEKFLAEVHPDDFTEMAISLHELGRYEKWALRIPNKTIYCTEEQLKKQRITLIDAIVQTGFANGNNKQLEYNFVDDEETFWDKIKAGGYFGYANNFLKQTYPNEYIGTKEEPTYKYLSSIDYKKEFVFARVNVDDDNTFSTDALSSNHIVQITGVNKEAGIVYYWSWGSNKYYSQNMKEPGVFEIIRIRR